jgi:hypothetical protein
VWGAPPHGRPRPRQTLATGWVVHLILSALHDVELISVFPLVDDDLVLQDMFFLRLIDEEFDLILRASGRAREAKASSVLTNARRRWTLHDAVQAAARGAGQMGRWTMLLGIPTRRRRGRAGHCAASCADVSREQCAPDSFAAGPGCWSNRCSSAYAAKISFCMRARLMAS